MGRVSANDAESDVLSYSLIGGDTDKYFILNSGVIHVSVSLIALGDSRDELVVMATDSGTPSRNATATVRRYNVPSITCYSLRKFNSTWTFL